MKDVSKQTLEHLIKFIYTGEVNVAQDNLKEFVDTVKALEIKGLVDDGYVQDVSNSPWSAPQSAQSKYNELQYQSTQTIRNQSQTPASDYERSPNVYPGWDDFVQKSSNETEENGHDFASNFDGNLLDDGTRSMDQSFQSYDHQWNADNYDNQSGGTPTKTKPPQAKRVKRVVGKY